MSVKSPYKNGGMFEGASPIIFENAKRLRKSMTDAEQVLWAYLRGRQGLKFRRQHPIGIYVADFYCHKLKLIIEVDGLIHEKEEMKDKDRLRQADLESWGHTVIRFTNEQVITRAKEVLASLDITIQKLNNIQKLNASPNSGV